MRKFIVQVNGVQYDVEIEEIGGACAPAAMPAVQSAPAPAPAAQSAPAAPAPSAPAAQSAPAPAAPAQSAPAAAQSMGGEAIKAPLPGTVLDIKVAPSHWSAAVFCSPRFRRQHCRYPRHDGGDAAGVLPWDVRKERSAHGKAAVVLCAVPVSPPEDSPLQDQQLLCTAYEGRRNL